jgi:hypothetical protein
MKLKNLLITFCIVITIGIFGYFLYKNIRDNSKNQQLSTKIQQQTENETMNSHYLSPETMSEEKSTSSLNRSIWIKTVFCRDTLPKGVTLLGNYNNTYIVNTPTGKELWVMGKVESNLGCRIGAEIVNDVLIYPPINSGLTLAIDNCHPKTNPPFAGSVSLVNKIEYEASGVEELRPIQVWKIIADENYNYIQFQKISSMEVKCITNEPDPQ